MNREEALKRSDEALQELASALKQGRSEKLVEYLEMLSKFHRYSFGNCMLIAFQRPSATLVAGFHRWKELGRFVKKGEAGIAILAPMVTRRKSKAKDPVEPDKDEESAESKAVCGFRVVHVFDVSQTDGQELVEFATIQGEPGEWNDRLRKFICSKGIELQYVDSLGGALGISEGGKISILATLSPAESFSTLVHELAHELLHRGDRRSETSRVIRETEAEAVAFVVSKAAGLQCSTKAADYILLWSGDEKILIQSLELIRETASAIIAELDSAKVLDLAEVA